MKQITKWKAEDGSEWDSMADASARDRLIAEVDAVMAPLGERERRHGEFTQRDQADIDAAKRGLYAIANRDGVLKSTIDHHKTKYGKTDADMIAVDPSWFCRVLDGNHEPLDRAYGRLCCIDNLNREWDSQYFANKANEEIKR